MRPVKSDWLLIVVGGLLGAFGGLVVAFGTMWTDGPKFIEFHLIYAVVTEYASPPEPGVNARIDAEVLGHWCYSRTSANPAELLTVLDILRWVDRAPGIAVIDIGFALGVQAGAIAGRWAQRPHMSASASSAPSR